MSSTPLSSDVRRSPGFFARPWFWLAIAFVLFAVPVVQSVVRSGRDAALPVMWQLPEWSLTDQDGRTFGSRDLRGRVYVADFIFTTCVLECPRLSRNMAHLQSQLARFGDRVHLVSISVDPVDDTPDRLREYMARYHADAHRWTFVTGPADAVMRAVSEGFRVGVEQPVRGPSGAFNAIELAHSNRFALVDGAGRLRVAAEMDDGGEPRVVQAVETLLSEGRPP